jgi:hypothetical protein
MFGFRFDSDFNVHQMQTMREKPLFSYKQKNFRFRLALFRFEAKMNGAP